jgi:hypothetical protein
LESLRYFDPITQISRESIETVTLPPAGELGLLKKGMASPPASGNTNARGLDAGPPLATLVDYLPSDAIFLLCEPETLSEVARNYAQQLPADDPFSADWEGLRDQIVHRGMTVLELEDGAGLLQPRLEDEDRQKTSSGLPDPPLDYQSLDAFRPLDTPAADPQIAEAQRREFFAQLHRWLRQGSGW